MSRTLIFGRGFLGQTLAASLPNAKLVATDISDRVAVESVLRDEKPWCVVNAAGKTGRPNVDWCETHQAETTRSNVIGAAVLAEACGNTSTHLLHLASGCIFYGESPTPGGWLEDDFANPTSFYSRSKYAADLLLSKMEHVAILRLRMPIASKPDPRNLITKLAGYKRVVDVENSVTIVEDLVKVVAGLLEKRASGVFHGTNAGTMRHRDLLALYKKYVDPKHEVELISEAELLGSGLVSKARSNCILASPRLEALGLAMRPIDVALEETMRAYAQAKNAA
ncbi:MAG: sugar nucleotide-binding protein [Polyangiaceae bacterium]